MIRNFRRVGHAWGSSRVAPEFARGGGHAIGPPSRESESPNTRSKGPIGYAAARKLAVCDLTKPPPAATRICSEAPAIRGSFASGLSVETKST